MKTVGIIMPDTSTASPAGSTARPTCCRRLHILREPEGNAHYNVKIVRLAT